MLKESYLANMKNLPKDAIKLIVTRSKNHPLSPSKELLFDYKIGEITWAQYEERFRKEMDTDEARFYMAEIKLLAKDQDVYLICFEKRFPCHRFILLDMINKMEV